MAKFKVGDEVMVLNNSGGGVWKKGHVGVVTDTDEQSSIFEVDGDVTESGWYVSWDLELVYTPKDIKNIPDGGPAEYYDFPRGAITLNDLIEFKGMEFHRGNIFKACWRWGEKSGVTKEYDARKIIYSGARLLKQLVGTKQLRETLQKMLDDPQFKEKEDG